MKYFELICKAYMKKNVEFQTSFEALSKYISFSMYHDGVGETHKKEGFKHYAFGGLLPVEKEKIYQQGAIYTFSIRSLDEAFIDTLSTTLRQNINNENLLVIETHKKIISSFFITELYSATPVIVSIDNGKYWTMQESGDIVQLQKQLHDNLEKKYQTFFGEPLHVKDNFIQLFFSYTISRYPFGTSFGVRKYVKLDRCYFFKCFKSIHIFFLEFRAGKNCRFSGMMEHITFIGQI